MPTGAQLFVDALANHGVREIFTLVGDHLNEALSCAAKSGLRIIDMRHEAAVAHAADAWARIHRRPAVALVTGGPGHTNAITGVATAFSAGSPLIAVSGSRANTQGERGAFQDLDQLGLMRPIVKWAAEPPDASQIPFYVGRAFSEAMAGRPGPVHLTIPVNLFTSGTSQPTGFPGAPASAPACPAAGDLRRAWEVLQSANKPVIIAGAGAWWSDAGSALQQFAERFGVPVYSISLGRGVYPDTKPLSMGYADPALNRAAARAFAEADVVLVVRKRIDFRLAMGGARLFSTSAKFIQIDVHPAEFGVNRRIDVAICADARTTLEALSAMGEGSQPRGSSQWLAELQSYRKEWEKWLADAAAERGTPIHPAALYAEVRKALPPETLYSWDGGDFAHWGRAMLPANHSGGWLRLGPLATIGAALPNGLALRLAHPDKPVVVLTGDGALGFYIAEFDSLVRHNLPVLIIVGNDAGWGLERELQGREHTVGCELRSTRYDIVMQGFGGAGENITTLDEVGPAIQRGLASGQPYLLNVNIRGVRSPFTRWKLGDE